MQHHQHDKQLFSALLADDVSKFSSLLHSDSQPKDSSLEMDYDLLCEAIKFSRLSVTRYLLDNGCCVRKPGSSALPLHSAIEELSRFHGWTNVVLKLLYAGARASDANANGDTALHVGFAVGVRGRMMDLLTRLYLEESGEDAVNAEGLSVLHIACTRPGIEFARELLDEKADVNRQVSNQAKAKFPGYAPLHFAVEFGNHEVADLLLKRGASIYEDDFNRSTPLHLACYCRDSRMIDLILGHDRVIANVVDKNGLSHFMIACTSGEAAFAEEHLRVAECRPWTSARILIDSCAKNVADCQFAGYTPLHFAAEFDSVAVSSLLLARGARCCATTSDRSLTPLMIAEKHGHEDIVRILRGYCAGYKMYEEMGLDAKDVAKDERMKKIDGNVYETKPAGKNFCITGSETAEPDPEVRVDSRGKSNTDSFKKPAFKRIIRISYSSECCHPDNNSNKRFRKSER